MAEIEPRRVHFAQADRGKIIRTALDEGGAYRKTARILAFEADGPFTVETDRGIMSGEAGDYIVTNHPEDDPGSDLWTISGARMAATFELAD